MSNPRVACLLSKRNNGPYFKDALESLLSQDYPFSDILISENHSTDGSEDLAFEAEKTYKNIKAFRPEQPAETGADATLNLLDRMPEADYYHFASADDIWDKTFISRLVQAFQSSNHYSSAAYCDFVDFYEDKIVRVSGNSYVPGYMSQGYALNHFLSGCSYLHQSALFHRDAVKSFHSQASLTSHSIDWAMMIDAAMLGGVIYYCKPLFYHRLHSGSTSQSSSYLSSNLEECLAPYLSSRALNIQYEQLKQARNSQENGSPQRRKRVISKDLSPQIVLAAHKLYLLKALRVVKGLDSLSLTSIT